MWKVKITSSSSEDMECLPRDPISQMTVLSTNLLDLAPTAKIPFHTLEDNIAEKSSDISRLIQLPGA